MGLRRHARLHVAAQQNTAPFFFDKPPELIRNQRDINAPSRAQAWVTFVRHGNGPPTISECGDENRDQRQRRIEREAREQHFAPNTTPAAGPNMGCLLNSETSSASMINTAAGTVSNGTFRWGGFGKAQCYAVNSLTEVTSMVAAGPDIGVDLRGIGRDPW